MLTFLGGKASERKLRLLGCACCRRAWRFLDAASREYVRFGEMLADGSGSVPRKILRQAGEVEFGEFARATAEVAARYAASWCLRRVRRPGVGCITANVAGACSIAGGGPRGDPELARRAEADEYAAQCRLARDIFGNPFRPVSLDPAWLTTNVVTLAQSTYQERALPSGHLDPARLAVLADTLEEAGADAELLAHLRDPGPHVRGCWAVDGVLGRS